MKSDTHLIPDDELGPSGLVSVVMSLITLSHVQSTYVSHACRQLIPNGVPTLVRPERVNALRPPAEQRAQELIVEDPVRDDRDPLVVWTLAIRLLECRLDELCDAGVSLILRDTESFRSTHASFARALTSWRHSPFGNLNVRPGWRTNSTLSPAKVWPSAVVRVCIGDGVLVTTHHRRSPAPGVEGRTSAGGGSRSPLVVVAPGVSCAACTAYSPQRALQRRGVDRVDLRRGERLAEGFRLLQVRLRCFTLLTFIPACQKVQLPHLPWLDSGASAHPAHEVRRLSGVSATLSLALYTS